MIPYTDIKIIIEETILMTDDHVLDNKPFPQIANNSRTTPKINIISENTVFLSLIFIHIPLILISIFKV